MLIRFSVKNFRSFHEEVVFSMLPGLMKKHNEHILKAQSKTGIDILRLGLLYGANASGKSNLIKAFSFLRNIILLGTRPKQSIPLQQFNLGNKLQKENSQFEIEFKVNEDAYAYGFILNSNQIIEEWLYKINSKDEKALFKRTTNKQGKAVVKFPNPNLLNSNDEQFRQFVAQSTRRNQLFLSKSIDQNLNDFDSVYDWFNDSLSIIFPDSHPHGIELMLKNNHDFTDALSEFLQKMNTGISNICIKPIEFESAKIPQEMIVDLIDELDDESSISIKGPDGTRYVLTISEESNSPQLFAMHTVRTSSDGREIHFDITEESDGTRRLIDLFPILYSSENKLFIIDEIERSLHPNLVRKFFKLYLESSSQGQLIATTHESTLLDLDLLRRDEIWFIEKSPDNQTILYSLEEFAPRADLDIRRGYLQGRFGAIPILGSYLSFQKKEGTAIAS